MKLGIIVGSTRSGRQTLKQAKWVANTARNNEDVQVEMIDLADYPLPFFAEAISPRYNPNRTVSPQVQKFLDVMNAQDAFIFVTPEYNHSIPGVLKNAFDYLTWEMNRKPAAIVSHGTAGGARAAMHLKEIISEGQAVPIPKSVAFAGIGDGIDEEGNISEELKANPYGQQAALDGLLDELVWYGKALKTARGGHAAA
ncbi:MAG TPA: NAD(P)H-dependent oxidoreductase [Candidatus Saccharimonadales bacterium]|nr:NAD(P)H-dependent oxidoreductase [Candidatus Saccharimonadales bacterium]